MIPFIMETFGGLEEDAVELLNDWARLARGQTPPGEEPPWSARNFIPYWSQVLTQLDGAARRRRRDPQPRSRGGRHSERDACPGRVSAWGALLDRFRVSELGLLRRVGFVVSLSYF